jgi:predicted ArsR family transcriptional regulator
MPPLEAIADPVRLAVARYLRRRPEASATEVAGGIGVHLNTARSHLTALVDVGVVERISDSGGRRGRPTVRYRVRDDWAPQGDELLLLSSLLATAIVRLDADPDQLRDVASEWGRRWSAAAGGQSIESRLTGALARLGFAARIIDGRVRLSACPCPLVSPDRPAVVCALADAVVDGVLEGNRLAAGDRSHNPARRRCSTDLVPA